MVIDHLGVEILVSSPGATVYGYPDTRVMMLSRFQVGCGLAGGLVSWEDVTMGFSSTIHPMGPSLQMNDPVKVSDRG